MVDASAIEYTEEPDLDATEFLALAQKVWPRDYTRDGVQQALRATINLVARAEGQLVGSVRILTDGHFSLSNEALNLSRRSAARRLTPVR
jgi:hypothetical protein